MNFAFFESLAANEADDYLNRFLELGGAALPTLVADAREAKVNADLSIPSVAPIMAWLASLATTTERNPDMSIPGWIRDSETYERNLFDFDEESKVLILRAAFYLGESFVRNFPSLVWAVGRVDTAEQGQPVITGFTNTMELGVLLVTENIFARFVADGPVDEKVSRTLRTLRTWESKVVT